MPWTPERYPPAMRNLDDATRAKAIEIANALLREGFDEGAAIRVAIATARQCRRADERGQVFPPN